MPRQSLDGQVEKVLTFLYYFHPDAYRALNDPKHRAKLKEWLR